MRSSLLRWALWLLVLSAGPVLAQPPPVRTDPRMPRIGRYDGAAKDANIADWGRGADSRRTVHVFIRVSADEERWIIGLPPGVPQAAAGRWLQQLSSDLGWASPDLVVSKQRDAMFVRAEVGIPVVYALRRDFTFDLAALERRLRAITNLPVIVAITLTAGELVDAQPPPVGTSDAAGENVFYRLGATPPIVTISSGVSHRLIAAAVVGLFSWLLFPPIVQLVVRRDLLRRRREDAKTRLQTYRRWQRIMLVAVMLGLPASMLLLGPQRLALFGPLASAALPALAFMPLALLAPVSRLIGLPLERDAWPQKRHVAWYVVAWAELATAMLALICLVALAMMPSLIAGSSGFSGVNAALAAAGLAATLIGVLTIVHMIRNALLWRRRKTGVPKDEDLAPEPLRQASADLAAQLGSSLERVLIRRSGPTWNVLQVVQASDGIAVLSEEMAGSLEVDQLAPLLVAQALPQPTTASDRVLAGVAWMTPGLFLLFGVWALAAAFRFGQLATINWAPIAVGGFLAWVLLLVTLAKAQAKRVEEADFRVAEAIPNPRRFIDALREIETLAAVHGGTDTDSDTSPLAQRRIKLTRRIGLD